MQQLKALQKPTYNNNEERMKNMNLLATTVMRLKDAFVEYQETFGATRDALALFTGINEPIYNNVVIWLLDNVFG